MKVINIYMSPFDLKTSLKNKEFILPNKTFDELNINEDDMINIINRYNSQIFSVKIKNMGRYDFSHLELAEDASTSLRKFFNSKIKSLKKHFIALKDYSKISFELLENHDIFAGLKKKDDIVNNNNCFFNFNEEFYKILNQLRSENNTQSGEPLIDPDFLEEYVIKSICKGNENTDVLENKSNLVEELQKIVDFYIDLIGSNKGLRDLDKDDLKNIPKRHIFSISSGTEFSLTLLLFSRLFFTKEGNDCFNNLYKKYPENMKNFIHLLFHIINIESSEYKAYFYSDLSKARILKEKLKEIFLFVIKNHNVDELYSFPYLNFSEAYSNDEEDKYKLSVDLHFSFFEKLTEYYKQIEGAEKYFSITEENNSNKFNQKKVKEIFWMRTLSKHIKDTFNKPLYKEVANMVNIMFDTIYTEDDIINYTRKQK